MNDVVPKVFRVVGWLLTPVVAGAAAFLGAWFGALLNSGLVFMVVGAALFGAGGTVGWALLLKRPVEPPVYRLG